MDSTIRINPERLKADFEALGAIGSTGDGGVHRPTFHPAHMEARAWLRRQIQEAGLEFRVDGAGNHSAFLGCSQPDAPTLLLGSHLDSVPYGGRFDGALGVLCALEALRMVKEARLKLPFNLEAIDFTDEEGTLFGLLGSSALAGKLTWQDLNNPRGGLEAFQGGLERAGLNMEGILSARRDPRTLAGYLEVHIEQGPRLARSGIEIGVVTSIVGIGSYRLIFQGRADHAGTTSMDDRLDAGQGAAAFVLAAPELIREKFPECVANTGWISFEPGAFNIVPARARLSLEYRSPQAEEFEQLENGLLDRAKEEADCRGLGLEIEFLGKHLPARMSPVMQLAIHQAASLLGLKAIPLSSGAGHDGQSLAGLCPTGMIFVPSVGGASHSSRELTRWEDCINGANVLLQAVLLFGSEENMKRPPGE